ncbi:U-box domain-containing protein 62-like [Quillaja saponaria]|uniref:U-box domain-containing protein 62-like n=1 Tax=Quillaja saponaria TaxID=32244 RepID=A0AAD7LVT6_QUISA|nr:U-box domain-containing protein 62-like [Quillaja saponaria]
MSPEEIGLVPSQRIESGLNSPLVFQDDTLRFNCGAAPQCRIGDPGPRTRELSNFIDDKMFTVERDPFFSPNQGAEFRRNVYGDCSDQRDPPDTRNWNGNGSTTTPSDDTEGNDHDKDDDEVDGDCDVEGLVGVDGGNKCNSNTVNDISNNNCSGRNLHSGADKISNGSSRGVLLKDANLGQLVNNNTRASTNENHQQERLDNYQNAVTIAETDSDVYYSQYLQDTEASLQKDTVVENGFSGRNDVYSSESGESLRAILSDPVTGALMDDAMILPCGHSFGGGGIQHVIRMKACCTCSQSISEDSVSPNLCSLVCTFRFISRATLVPGSKVVMNTSTHQNLKHFELLCRHFIVKKSHSFPVPPKEEERLDQDKCNYGVSTLMEPPRGRGVQFPFAVTDRVIIKGNKRTPQRFVGREAVVTTQCLNGWYVVKTLDNAESVKLQYRSLAKVSDELTNPASSKMGPNWHLSCSMLR